MWWVKLLRIIIARFLSVEYIICPYMFKYIILFHMCFSAIPHLPERLTTCTNSSNQEKN